MNWEKIKKIHFVGIKGVGMAALACICQDAGFKISGSDVKGKFITDELVNRRGFIFNSVFEAKNLPETDLVVYSGGHMAQKNPQVMKALAKKIATAGLSEVLAHFMNQKKQRIAVAGVGGKSTSSAMLSFLFDKAKLAPSFFVGVGEIAGLGDPGRFDKDGQIFVSEADEYFDPKYNEPKFLQLDPNIVLLPNLAFDHPDVYKDKEDTYFYFNKFLSRVETGGYIIINSDCDFCRPLIVRYKAKVISYGFGEKADWQIKIKKKGEKQELSLNDKKNNKKYQLSISLSGDFNALNAAGVAITALKSGLNEGDLKYLKDFKGSKRRLEKIYASDHFVLYDDYAHHPAEIYALLTSLKKLYKNKKLVVLFQPHTFSRTKHFLQEFADSLKIADQLLLIEIFASAREAMGNVSSRDLVNLLQKKGSEAVFCSTKDECSKWIKNKLGVNSVFLTLGAGNLFNWHKSIIGIIKEKEKNA